MSKIELGKGEITMEEMFDVMAETPNGREKTPSEMTVEELRQWTAYTHNSHKKHSL